MIYKTKGIYFTWASAYGTQFHHGIFSTDGTAYSDDITLNSYGNVRINFDSNNNGSNKFTIGHHTTGLSNTLFTLLEDGKVGIGTTSPGKKLHVVTNGWKARFSGSDGYIDIGPANSGWAHIYTDRPSFIFNKDIYSITGGFSAYSTSNLYLKTNGSAKMTILSSNGNIGIGKTNPSKKLDVNGDINFTGNLYKNGVLVNTGGGSSQWKTNGSNIYYNTGKVGIGTNTPKHTIHLFGTGTGGGGSKIAFGDCNTFEYAHQYGGLNCLVGEYGDTDTDKLHLHGKTGIILTTGNYQFGYHQKVIDISYEGGNIVRLNGKLLANEVEVVFNVWADHVFKEDYELKTIHEVNNFIKENGHLPDVPNEEEVKKEGVNLGEMDAILLQKVEELTLYIIQLENRISELENK